MIITNHCAPHDGRVTVVQGPAFTATICTSQENGEACLVTSVLEGDHTGTVVARCCYGEAVDVAGRHEAHLQVVADLNLAAATDDLLIATKAALTRLKDQGLVQAVRIAI